MSQLLDPARLFRKIADHLPDDLHGNILIVGSLAAAFHYRAKLTTRAVNTKDADVMIQPAGAIAECSQIASRLLAEGWTRARKCFPQASAVPADTLRAIRLHPPESDDYFIELLGLPDAGQAERLRWTPVELDDGWYGLPCFRFLALTEHDPQPSKLGLAYAAPEMMALANLLSHPVLGKEEMSEPVGGRQLLRSAKDLGRVLALAWLAGPAQLESWPAAWDDALRLRFPDERQALAAGVASGLRALLRDRAVLEQARHGVEVGLLSGKGLTVEQLGVVGDQFLREVVEPFTTRVGASG